jgi:hypothetical protein
MRDETNLAESFEGEEGETTTFPLSGAWWALIFNLFLVWEDCTGECAGEAWTIGLTMEEEQVETNWASHDVGRLSGGQSLAIHHFQGLQVVMRHEGELGYQGHVGLGKEAFLA